MKFIKYIFWLLVLASAHVNVYADDFMELKHEKISLEVDRQNYASGDTIHLKGVIFDGFDGTAIKDFSKYIYIEIINPFGELECRKKLKVTEGSFNGTIPIAPDFTEGIYTITAYTLFMRNIQSRYFFKTPVPIANILTKKYYIKSGLENNCFYAKLIDRSTGNAVECCNIGLYVNGKKITEAHNQDFIKWKYNDNQSIVKVSFDNYSKYIVLPSTHNKPDITFHPEGGILLAGCSNAVGIKVSDKHQAGISIEGIIEDSNGNYVCSFTTDNNGFGLFRFIPDSNLQYYAIIDNVRAQLPDAVSKGPKLSLNTTQKEKITIAIDGNINNDLLLTIGHNGKIIYITADSMVPIQLNRNSLPSGLISFRLSTPADSVISYRYMFNKPDTMNADIVAQDIGFRLDSTVLYSHSAQQRILLDAISLCLTTDRYDMSKYDGSFPVEIGGELSGFVKTEWRNKPVKDAIVNVISPSLGTAYETTTDVDGFFSINGLDWPENAVFVCSAKKANGEILPNLSIIEDSYPRIDPLPMHRESNDSMFYSIVEACPNSTLLQEVKVIANRHQEDQNIILASMGIRSVTEQIIEQRNITSYEEAIRMFPGIFIQNGNILSRRNSSSIYGNNGGSNVEIWVDGIQWNPSFIDINDSDIMSDNKPQQTTAIKATLNKTAQIMTGGLLPEDVAKKQYMSSMSIINELSGCYPFSIVKSIDYIPSYSASIISRSAAYGGGALVITTKTDNSKRSDYRTGLKVFRPLGYQETCH